MKEAASSKQRIITLCPSVFQDREKWWEVRVTPLDDVVLNLNQTLCTTTNLHCRSPVSMCLWTIAKKIVPAIPVALAHGTCKNCPKPHSNSIKRIKLNAKILRALNCFLPWPNNGSILTCCTFLKRLLMWAPQQLSESNDSKWPLSTLQWALAF